VPRTGSREIAYLRICVYAYKRICVYAYMRIFVYAYMRIYACMLIHAATAGTREIASFIRAPHAVRGDHFICIYDL